MQAIITGVDGFVGSSVATELLSNGWSVIGIDLGPASKRIQPNPLFRYLSSKDKDLDNLGKVIEKMGPTDVFYHFAWRGVSGPERGSEEIQLQNALLTTKWLREAKKIGCKKFISSGSIMEFETSQVVYEQGTKPGLGYIYGSAKTAAHGICKSIANDIGIDLVWAYITNTYGVGEASQRMLNTTLRKIIHNEPLDFTEGKQNYDFIYISDVALAFRLLGEFGRPNKAYVIGSGSPRPLREYLEEIVKEIKPTSKVTFGSIVYSGVQTPFSFFDIHELIADTGFQPKVSFSEGIKKTYEWLRKEK